MTTEFICRRCARQISSQTKFFMTNCSHLICFDCVKKCLREVPPDANGLYTICCPIEREDRKILPIDKLPSGGRMLFRPTDKVFEKLHRLISVSDRRMREQMHLIKSMQTQIKELHLVNTKLREKIRNIRDGVNCQYCGQKTLMNESGFSVESFGSRQAHNYASKQSGAGSVRGSVQTGHRRLSLRSSDHNQSSIIQQLIPKWSTTPRAEL